MNTFFLATIEFDYQDRSFKFPIIEFCGETKEKNDSQLVSDTRTNTIETFMEDTQTAVLEKDFREKSFMYALFCFFGQKGFRKTRLYSTNCFLITLCKT